MMKAIVHVHQQKIKKGEAAIIVRTYKGSTHHRRVAFTGPCVLIQSETPDSCGARVWIETDSDNLILDPNYPLTTSVDRETLSS